MMRDAERIIPTKGVPLPSTFRRVFGSKWSLLMASGYRDALKIPAFATERNAMIAATPIMYAPVLDPVIAAATVETGVRFIPPLFMESKSVPTTPTIISKPTM